MATGTAASSQVTKPDSKSSCDEVLAKPTKDLNVLDLPPRLACEVLSGAQQSFSSVSSEVKDGVKWMKDAVTGNVSKTEVVTTLAASALVAGMALESKRDPIAAEEAAEGGARWGQRAWQFVRAFFTSNSPAVTGGAAAENAQPLQQVGGKFETFLAEQRELAVQAHSVIETYSQTPIARRFGEVLVSNAGKQSLTEALSRAYFDICKIAIVPGRGTLDEATKIGSELDGLLDTLQADPRFAESVRLFHERLGFSR